MARPSRSVARGCDWWRGLGQLGDGTITLRELRAPDAPSSLGMAAVFFALNSGLTSIALALETGASPFQVWRGHARYLAVNYYAAASLATLAVGNGSGVNFTVVGLVVPLLILSYVAYREASTRIDKAHRHVGEVEHLYHAAVEMLAIAVDTNDQITHAHSPRPTAYARRGEGARHH